MAALLALPVTAAAQDFESMRPVPKVRSSAILSTVPSNQGGSQLRRPGWNLQWRQSPSVQRDEARRISDQAFRATPSSSAVVNQVGVEQSPLHTAEPNPVQQATWLAEPTQVIRQVQAEDLPAPSPSGFSLPGFGEPEPSQTLPEPGTASSNTLPSPDPATQKPDWFDNPFRDESRATPDARPPVPQTGPVETLPSPNLPPVQPEVSPELGPSEDSSIRDMLDDGPDEISPPMPDTLDAPPPIQPAPSDSLDMEDSPSDRELFDSNPFQRRGERNEETGGNEDSVDLGDSYRPRTTRPRGKSIFDDDDQGLIGSAGVGLTCDEFRKRIAASTIDQVSLDISPPFRPDVIDEREYQKLKGRFDEEQTSRTWRSIEGRELGKGQLVDLAYEKAVIVSEFGTNEELPLNRLSEADLAYISENWGLPTECLIEQVDYIPRRWQPTTMVYAASNLCHHPLYFEEVNLERYGHTAGPLAQPLISSAHFFVNICVLPYKMGVHSPHECQYALGYYRPGNCAPWIIPPVPLSVKGAWYQAAAVTGTALLVP